MAGTVEARAVALGNLKLFDELRIAAGELPIRAEVLRSDGQTVMLLAIDGRAAGLIGVADPIKDSTSRAALGWCVFQGAHRAVLDDQIHRFGMYSGA